MKESQTNSFFSLIQYFRNNTSPQWILWKLKNRKWKMKKRKSVKDYIGIEIVKSRGITRNWI